MVDLGIVELVPDPADGRAKLVRYTEAGRAQTHLGFLHIRRFEQRLTDELGDDYEAAAPGARTGGRDPGVRRRGFRPNRLRPPPAFLTWVGCVASSPSSFC